MRPFRHCERHPLKQRTYCLSRVFSSTLEAALLVVVLTLSPAFLAVFSVALPVFLAASPVAFPACFHVLASLLHVLSCSLRESHATPIINASRKKLGSRVSCSYMKHLDPPMDDYLLFPGLVAWAVRFACCTTFSGIPGHGPYETLHGFQILRPTHDIQPPQRFPHVILVRTQFRECVARLLPFRLRASPGSAPRLARENVPRSRRPEPAGSPD